jgi:hypothetical protein
MRARTTGLVRVAGIVCSVFVIISGCGRGGGGGGGGGGAPSPLAGRAIDPLSSRDLNLPDYVIVRPFNRTELTWALAKPTSKMPVEDQLAAIEIATRVWSDACAVSITRAAVGQEAQADLQFRFEVGDHGDGAPFDGAGGVIAHAFFPSTMMEGELHIDDDEDFTVDIFGSDRFDLGAILIHELGHNLGLEHTDVEAAMMFPTYKGARRALDADDEAGIHGLYGAPDGTDPPSPYRPPVFDPDGGDQPPVAPGDVVDTDDDGLDDSTEVFIVGTDPQKRDSDQDGIDDGTEVFIGTNPRSADTDNDGVDDQTEFATGGGDPLNPCLPNPCVYGSTGDPDGDGLSNAEEAELGTNPDNPDTDGDLVNDFLEARLMFTDPLRVDTDGDGCPDGLDRAPANRTYGCDPGDAEPAAIIEGSTDLDGDGLLNSEEESRGTNPRSADTDNDRLDDFEEVFLRKTDPNKKDTDGDGSDDFHDWAPLDPNVGTDPLDRDGGDEFDADADGLLNTDESVFGTDPNQADTDGDGVNDYTELFVYASDPLNCADPFAGQCGAGPDGGGDRDADGLPDAVEATVGTNPDDPDTDGDGESDGEEVSFWESDPLDCNDPFLGCQIVFRRHSPRDGD